MMINVRKYLLTISLVILTGYLFAGGFALSGVGSRATSMGGAFRAMSDDASAMYWNPAGLGFMNENSVHLGGTFIMPAAKWDPTGTPLSGIPGFAGKEYESEQELKMIPTLAFVKTKESRLKYGVGLFVPYGLGTKWDAYQLPANLTYANGLPKYELLSGVSVFDLHPSVAYRVMHNLSVGAGISLMYGNIEINKIGFASDLTDPLNFVKPISTELAGNGMGFGANLGVLYKPLPGLSLGISGKIPSTVAMKGDADINCWIPATQDSLGNVNPPLKLGGKEDIEADLKLPAEFGMGVAYQLLPQLTLSLDYAYTMWERLDKVDIVFKNPHTLAGKQSELVFDWENTSRISLGAEYLLGLNKLRGGFFFDQSPVPESTQIPTLSDIGDKLSFNLGYGRIIGPVEVELNGQYVHFPERKVEAATPNNTLGVYNSQSVSANLGLTYRF